MLEPNHLEVRILGQKITLKATDRDPAETREIMNLVVSRIASAESRSKAKAAHQIALLALLDLAEEYVLARKRTAEHQTQLQTQLDELIRRLENGEST